MLGRNYCSNFCSGEKQPRSRLESLPLMLQSSQGGCHEAKFTSLLWVQSLPVFSLNGCKASSGEPVEGRSSLQFFVVAVWKETPVGSELTVRQPLPLGVVLFSTTRC